MPFRVARSRAAVVVMACSVCLAVAGAGYAIAMPSGRSSAAVQLTGRQLAALLVPASALPRGYQLDRRFSHDSGSRLETAAAKYDLATMSCLAINDANGRAGFGESAYAENSYSLNVSGLASTGLLQQVYQFGTAKAAASYWRGLRAILIRCPGFGEATSPVHGKFTQRVFAVRYGRGQAFGADMTETGLVGGTVNGAMLVVVAGDDVFSVLIIGYSRPVPADPSARTLMNDLIARVS